MPDLNGKRIAFLCATEGTEQIELTSPREALEGAGATTDLLSTESGEIRAFDHLTAADTFPVDRTVAEASVDDYDALVLPGGVANPDNLRMHGDAVAFIKGFFHAGKQVSVICHGPWTLIEAGVVEGRTITSWPSLQTDLRNAGATWKDEEVVVCDAGPNVLLSSRKPDDLEAFNKHTIDQLAAR
ncbi:MAG: type 1 glutamine amidotransferase [Actinobacteria bacterium]|nr:type 1 glutamine amidotransferase [Actinomycetota bacterium]